MISFPDLFARLDGQKGENSCLEYLQVLYPARETVQISSDAPCCVSVFVWTNSVIWPDA